MRVFECAVATIMGILIMGILAAGDSANAVSRTLCGQTVEFNIAPPATDVPAEVRALSGVWLGHWLNSGRCVALIFEKVGRDGTVDMVTVIGPEPGYAANAGLDGYQKVIKHKGQLKNGVLDFQGVVHVTYRVSKPGEITSRAEWISGSGNGILKRQSY